MNKNSLPFGLLFEEEFDLEGISILPIYDEELDISIFFDKDGNKIPFVEHFGSINTGTVTKTVSEDSDEDPTMNLMKTRTLTEGQEDSDSDEENSYNLSTKTMTFDQSEQADEDE